MYWGVFGLTKFQQYLEHRKFQLHTDNSILTVLLNHSRQVGKISRWITFIKPFQFKVTHIPAAQNVMSDFLSRMSESKEATALPLAPITSETRQVHQVKQPLTTTLGVNKQCFSKLEEELAEVRELPSGCYLRRTNSYKVGLENRIYGFCL